MAWIKFYVMVPHSWIFKTLQMFSIEEVLTVLKNIINDWKNLKIDSNNEYLNDHMIKTHTF